MSEKIVIIGGVAAGPKVAARARRLSPRAEITIIERGQLISYAGCGMPFYLSGQIKDYNELFTTPYGVKRDEQFFFIGTGYPGAHPDGGNGCRSPEKRGNGR